MCEDFNQSLVMFFSFSYMSLNHCSLLRAQSSLFSNLATSFSRCWKSATFTSSKLFILVISSLTLCNLSVSVKALFRVLYRSLISLDISLIVETHSVLEISGEMSRDTCSLLSPDDVELAINAKLVYSTLSSSSSLSAQSSPSAMYAFPVFLELRRSKYFFL